MLIRTVSFYTVKDRVFFLSVADPGSGRDRSTDTDSDLDKTLSFITNIYIPFPHVFRIRISFHADPDPRSLK